MIPPYHPKKKKKITRKKSKHSTFKTPKHLFQKTTNVKVHNKRSFSTKLNFPDISFIKISK